MTAITEMPPLVGKKLRVYLPPHAGVLHLTPQTDSGVKFDNPIDNPAHDPLYIGNVEGKSYVFYLNGQTGQIQKMLLEKARFFAPGDPSDYPKA